MLALVLDDGKLGLLIAHALVAAGVQTVVVGHHEQKLRIAASYGAETRADKVAPDAGGALGLWQRAPALGTAPQS